MQTSHQLNEKKFQINSFVCVGVGVADKTILIYYLTMLLCFLQQNLSCLLYNVTLFNIILTGSTFLEYLEFYFILPYP